VRTFLFRPLHLLRGPIFFPLGSLPLPTSLGCLSPAVPPFFFFVCVLSLFPPFSQQGPPRTHALRIRFAPSPPSSLSICFDGFLFSFSEFSLLKGFCCYGGLPLQIPACFLPATHRLVAFEPFPRSLPRAQPAPLTFVPFSSSLPASGRQS